MCERARMNYVLYYLQHTSDQNTVVCLRKNRCVFEDNKQDKTLNAV